MPKKDPAAVALGRKGGEARLHTMTPEERSEQASHAATVRWAKVHAKVDTRPLRPELQGQPHFELVHRFRRTEGLLGRFLTEQEARLERKTARGCIHGGKFLIRYCEA